MSCFPWLPAELIHEIFSSPCLSQLDLSVLARASRDWHNIATPILWRRLPGLLPLLKLIPEDASSIIPIQCEDERLTGYPIECITITRPLIEEDWTPVYRRAVLVKDLEVHASYSPLCSEFTTQTLEAIAACPPSRCLLPELRSLHLDINLRHVFHTNTHLTSLLEILLSPNITGNLVEDLRFEKDLGFTRLTEAHAAMLVNAAATRWTHLKSVSLQVELCGPSLLATFSQMPALELLKLAFEQSAEESDIIPVSLTPGFLSLRSLELGAVASDAAAAVLQSWDLRALQSFEITRIHNCAKPEDLLQAIHDCIAHDALRVLSIEADFTTGPAPMLEHLRPIAVFRRLVDVFIDVNEGLLLTDDDHAQLAGWWPEAEYIFFNSESHCRISNLCTPATLHCLTHYARCCPRLQELCLPLVAHPPIPVVPADTPSGHPLYDLEIGDAPLYAEDAAEVAQFLVGVFPHLEEVEYLDRGYSVAWKHVNALLEYRNHQAQLDRGCSDSRRHSI
ncbi:uncharacterized protein SCHCODRAFT_02690527 [Schizophyllum commune H4-8]|nr:uncharacterized protein SCHCODRAFT_02690527 [Schizophyllum commune H4-8]KAI5890588.1 hypothetical protein SCHCODRAFT_02690527 [Schizophyllum commune H4-8]